MSQGPWLMHLLLQRLPNYGMCLPLVRSEMILGGTWTWHQRALDHTVKSYFLSITSKRKISDWYLQDSNSSLNLLTYFPLPHQWSLFPKSVKGIRLPELTKSTKTINWFCTINSTVGACYYTCWLGSNRILALMQCFSKCGTQTSTITTTC